jgi:hypothetical protein
MPYREKSAWASLIAMLVAYGVYFVLIVPRLLAAPEAPLPYLGLLFGCCVGLVILEIAMQTFVAVTMRDQANLPMDERERLIALKSDRVALIVLTTLIASGWTLYAAAPALLGSSAALANLLLLTLVLSAAAKHASVIVYFRRGA